MTQKEYIIENLDCANCGNKIQEKIKELPYITEAILSFPTKKLIIKGDLPNNVYDDIYNISNSIEDGIRLIEKKKYSTMYFNTDNLDCPSCGAKIESKIKELPYVEDANLTVATSTLKISGNLPDNIVNILQDICDSIEDGVIISIKNQSKALSFKIQGLDCAHCAGVIEEKINGLEFVKNATLIFPTKTLKVSGNLPENILEILQKTADSVEEGVIITLDNKKATRTFEIENLHCANCANKIQEAINKLDYVDEAILNFTAKKIKITGDLPENITQTLTKLASSIEDGVIIKNPSININNIENSNNTNINENTGSFVYNLKSSLKQDNEGIYLGFGILFYLCGLISEFAFNYNYSFAIYLLSYGILGHEVIIKSLKNIIKGKIFDENFLMSVATIGAFSIGQFEEAVGVMLFYKIGELFEHIAVNKSRNQIMSTVDLRPETVNLVNDNEVVVIPAEAAKIGDIILVKPGDRIPLDGKVIVGNGSVDTKAITGEPIPVNVNVGDSVLSGYVNNDTILQILVEKPLEDSMVSRILESVENAAASKPKIDKFITKFSKVYTPFVVFSALAVAIIPSLITGNYSHWIYTALTFLVISCPCALVLSVPLAFFSGIGAGSKLGILFKGGSSIDALKNIKAVALDKTGTITKGDFTVSNIKVLGDFTEDELLQICASCQQGSNHPIAQSIVKCANDKNLNLYTVTNLKEVLGEGIMGDIDLGKVICGNKKLMANNNIPLNLSVDEYGVTVFVSLNNKVIGYILITDTIKDDAKESIKSLKSNGLFTVMLTGDNQKNANHVGNEVGVDEAFGGLLPVDKVNILQEVRKNNGSTIFVGDGINDAPVIASADVGGAMGSGADAALEACDVVFMNSDIKSIENAYVIAKTTSLIAIENVVFALGFKALIMILGVLGFANMWMAVFADTGVAIICLLNSMRLLYKKFIK